MKNAVNTRIQNILDAPSVPVDPGYLEVVVRKVAEHVFQEWDIASLGEDHDWGDHRIDIKALREYDHRRSALLYVMYHKDRVISMGSFAGRELDDVHNVVIYNRALVWDLVQTFIRKHDDHADQVWDPQGTLDVVYWEGAPLELGKHGCGLP